MKIFSNFAKKIVTREDLIFFLEEINLVKGAIFKNINIPLSKKVKRNISEDFRKELEELERNKIIIAKIVPYLELDKETIKASNRLFISR